MIISGEKMKKAVLFLLVLLIINSGCTKKTDIQQPKQPSLSVEQVNNYNKQITELVKKKSWILQEPISYTIITLPNSVENTYYSEILAKSKDSKYDFSKHLGKETVEGRANIKYSNGDVAGLGHFLFAQDKIIGAYYTVGDYIYSLNEKEVFKKHIEWKSVENLQKKNVLKEVTFASMQNLVYWSKYKDKESFLFSLEQDKLKQLNIQDNRFIIIREVNLDNLYLVSMFVNDVDRDNKVELAVLVSSRQKWWEDGANSKLLIYEYGEKLKPKYSLTFMQPMWSIDFDGKDIIATSSNSIEMYSIEDNTLKKNYAYNKVGGIIKVDDIDNSGVPKYILRDSSGTDIYVFQRTKDGLEEIWRSYNHKPEIDGNIQIADLNGDGIKEVFLQDKSGNTRKIVLQEKGFIEQNNDIKNGHKYFTGDFNMDGKYECFDTYKLPKSKGLATIYKY